MITPRLFRIVIKTTKNNGNTPHCKWDKAFTEKFFHKIHISIMRICLCVLVLLSPALYISTTTRLLRQRQLFDSHDIENISQKGKKGLGLRRVLTKSVWFIFTSKMYQKMKSKLEKKWKIKRFEWVVNLFMKQSKWHQVSVAWNIAIDNIFFVILSKLNFGKWLRNNAFS